MAPFREKRLDEMAWENIATIRSVSDRAFASDVLEARRDFLSLRLRHEPAIRSIYLDAADQVAGQIRTLSPTVGQLTRNHLAAMEKALRREAERIAGATSTLLRDGMTQATSLGGRPLDNHLVRAVTEAGAPLDLLKLQRGFADINTSAVEALWARTYNGLTVSDRIWQQSQTARDAMRDMIHAGVAQGRDAVQVARDLEQYVRHGSKSLSGDYRKMMARMGTRVPKDMSYEALRLARTEYTMAYTEGTYSRGRVNPAYEGVRWLLSDAHPEPDVCCRLGTEIATSKGQVPIEDVKVGDLVVTHRGRLRPVSRLYRRTIQDEEMILLRYQAGKTRIQELVLTHNHPVLTAEGWVPASHLNKGSRVAACFLKPGEQVNQLVRDDKNRASLDSVENVTSLLQQSNAWQQCDVLGHLFFHRIYSKKRGCEGPSSLQSFEYDICPHQSNRLSSSDCSFRDAIQKAVYEVRQNVQVVPDGVCHNWGYSLHHAVDTGLNSSVAFDRQQTACHKFRRFGELMHDRSNSIVLNRSAELFRWAWPGKHYRIQDIVLKCDWICFGQHIYDYKIEFLPNGLDVLHKMEQEQFGCHTVHKTSLHGPPLPCIYLSMQNGYIQPYSVNTTKTHKEVVYNLAVDEDNSYIANGLCVHNCDDFAQADLYGKGRGVYPKGEEPLNPHPNCLCFVVPIVADVEDFVGDLEEWLDERSSHPELEQWYNDVYRPMEGVPIDLGSLEYRPFTTIQEAEAWAER